MIHLKGFNYLASTKEKLKTRPTRAGQAMAYSYAGTRADLISYDKSSSNSQAILLLI